MGLPRWPWWWRMHQPMQETWETWVRFLGWEDSLEEEMATHSSILAWRISRIEKPGGLQRMGLQRVRHNWSDRAHIYLFNRLSCGMQDLSCSMWDPASQPGIEPGPPLLGECSPSHWITREVPLSLFWFSFLSLCNCIIGLFVNRKWSNLDSVQSLVYDLISVSFCEWQNGVDPSTVPYQPSDLGETVNNSLSWSLFICKMQWCHLFQGWF